MTPAHRTRRPTRRGGSSLWSRYIHIPNAVRAGSAPRGVAPTRAPPPGRPASSGGGSRPPLGAGTARRHGRRECGPLRSSVPPPPTPATAPRAPHRSHALSEFHSEKLYALAPRHQHRTCLNSELRHGHTRHDSVDDTDITPHAERVTSAIHAHAACRCALVSAGKVDGTRDCASCAINDLQRLSQLSQFAHEITTFAQIDRRMLSRSK